jgi:hypothetical protein
VGLESLDCAEKRVRGNGARSESRIRDLFLMLSSPRVFLDLFFKLIFAFGDVFTIL